MNGQNNSQFLGISRRKLLILAIIGSLILGSITLCALIMVGGYIIFSNRPLTSEVILSTSIPNALTNTESPTEPVVWITRQEIVDRYPSYSPFTSQIGGGKNCYTGMTSNMESMIAFCGDDDNIKRIGFAVVLSANFSAMQNYGDDLAEFVMWATRNCQECALWFLDEINKIANSSGFDDQTHIGSYYLEASFDADIFSYMIFIERDW